METYLCPSEVLYLTSTNNNFPLPSKGSVELTSKITIDIYKCYVIKECKILGIVNKEIEQYNKESVKDPLYRTVVNNESRRSVWNSPLIMTKIINTIGGHYYNDCISWSLFSSVLINTGNADLVHRFSKTSPGKYDEAKVRMEKLKMVVSRQISVISLINSKSILQVTQKYHNQNTH